MTYQNLPPRQKSLRLINRLRTEQPQLQYQQYKLRARNISNIAELLPGLNDITDAFEALPLDLVKYFTLLKEIDAKCINTVPQINYLIKQHVEELHRPLDELELEQNASVKTSGRADVETATETETAKTETAKTETAKTETAKTETAKTETAKTAETVENTENILDTATGESKPKSKRSLREFQRLTLLKDKINEIIPCLEEKMHVTAVASDLVSKHMFRINNDYKLIINNNEVPELIRIGPLNHPAMIVDSAGGASPNYDRSSAVDRSAHSQRSESRREALAAKKATHDEEPGIGPSPNSPALANYKKKKTRETTPFEGAMSGKKRSRKEASEGPESAERQTSPLLLPQLSADSKKKSKPRRDDETKPGIHFRESAARVGSIHAGYRDPENSASSRDVNNEPTYCYCDQVSFGEMVGCDGDDCKREWFHLQCIGYKQPPKGKWYCDDCVTRLRKRKL